MGGRGNIKQLGINCPGQRCPNITTSQQITHSSPTTHHPLTVRPTYTVRSPSDFNKAQSGFMNSKENIGIIVAIAVTILLAVIILFIALYKFCGRDEGTYEIDESRYFTSMDCRDGQQGDNTLQIHSDTGKRSHKKGNVKEWYV